MGGRFLSAGSEIRLSIFSWQISASVHKLGCQLLGGQIPGGLNLEDRFPGGRKLGIVGTLSGGR